VSLKMSMYTCPVGSGCEELVVLEGGGGGRWKRWLLRWVEVEVWLWQYN